MKVWRTIQQSLQRHKKLAVAAIAGIVVVAGYGFWSNYVWQQYEHAYSEAAVHAKTTVNAALTTPQSTEEEKAQKTSAITKVVDSYQPLDCHITPLVAWQTFLDGMRHKKATCEELATRLDTLNGAIKDVSQYLKDGQQLVAVMATEDKPETITEDTLEAQVKAWQQTKQKVISLEASKAFVPVKEKAQEAAEAIANTWHQLLEANKAQDQSAYEKTRAQLSESYDKLAAIAPVSSTQLTGLAKQLQTAYDQIP
jgi:hypothetical protein